jgi:pyruvate formate lyase activating enzyme
MLKKIIWSSLLDYPNEISTVLFLGGCNYECCYCHNYDLNKLPDIEFKHVLYRLISRQSFINHVIISGGEPTIHGDKFIELVKTLKRNGFNIGLHTNGSNLEVIKQSIDYIDFIGMDIKTSIEEYKKHNSLSYGKNIEKTIKFLCKQSKNKKIEFRTTCDTYYVSLSDLNLIGSFLKKQKINKKNVQWALQRSTRQYESQLLLKTIDLLIKNYKHMPVIKRNF